MSFIREVGEATGTSEYISKCASEAADIFYIYCAEEAKKGARKYTATAHINSDTDTSPLVMASVEEAEKVKKLILVNLTAKESLRFAAMVYKDGPYRRQEKKAKLFRSDKDPYYFLIKIKISASW
jgi:hypothetical protein